MMQSLLSLETSSDLSLKELTTWRIGGAAAKIFFPKTLAEIQQVVLLSVQQQVQLGVIGYGSNLLIDDHGFDGFIIVLKKNFSKFYFEEEDLLVVESGFACPRLARMTWNLGFKNLTFLSGIPGSVGGAVQMNAGAHHYAIMDYVYKVELMDYQGILYQYYRHEIEAEYRKTTFPFKGIITRVWLSLKKEGSLDLITVLNYRSQTQPLGDWSCGSVFKNPHHQYSAGWLIEQVGLKGLRVGDLEISTKHANFMLNVGSATSIDVLDLTLFVQQRVYLLTGYWLQPEYQRLNSCF
jgi:UDP-N-acetylmuramate dehydrogenase